MPAGPLVLRPRVAECAIPMPDRDETYDMARLLRAEQFPDCERDGFPKHLAPPWKNSVEGKKTARCVRVLRRESSQRIPKWRTLTTLPSTLHRLATPRKLQVAGQRDSATCGDAFLTFGLPTGPSRLCSVPARTRPGYERFPSEI